MPRAGSTLIEQILSSHSQVEGTSELPDIPALARRDAAYPEGLVTWSAERLRETVCGIRVTRDGDAMPVTTSVGGHWDGNGINLLTALRLADRALYRAKQEGRNRTEFAFAPAMAAA